MCCPITNPTPRCVFPFDRILLNIWFACIDWGLTTGREWIIPGGGEERKNGATSLPISCLFIRIVNLGSNWNVLWIWLIHLTSFSFYLLRTIQHSEELNSLLVLCGGWWWTPSVERKKSESRLTAAFYAFEKKKTILQQLSEIKWIREINGSLTTHSHLKTIQLSIRLLPFALLFFFPMTSYLFSVFFHSIIISNCKLANEAAGASPPIRHFILF